MESAKNINKNFSSAIDDEPLTIEGKEKASLAGDAIYDYLRRNRFSCSCIHTANSLRAIQSAEAIQSVINAPDIRIWNELRSTNSGVLRGRTEEEATNSNPLFMQQLKLYRCGLYSSYGFEHINDKENKKSYEEKVMLRYNKIIKESKDDVVLFVVHHSPLTAILINLARQFYQYPLNFYGKVDCELGNYYLLDVSNHNVTFEMMNADFKELYSNETK
jgi:broad specificity phosphatase PhoE